MKIKSKNLMLVCLVACAMFCLDAASVFAYVKVKEESSSQLTQLTQQIEQQEKTNLGWDKERFKQLKEGLDKLMVSRRETADLMNKFQKIRSHESLLDTGMGTTDFNNKESDDLANQGEGKYADYVMKTIDFAQEFIDSTGKIKVAVWESPKWEAVEKKTSFLSPRAQKLLVKVSSKKQKEIARKMKTERLGDMIFDLARGLLPNQLMKEFDGGKLSAYLGAKAGVIELADGIFSRPTEPQDHAYVKYANLGCNELDEVLFWSDISVANGYHPTFGTALNQTILTGAKQVDMDDIISRGNSAAIDKWNRACIPAERLQNPFRGYASKVIPGLIVMSEQGRLKPHHSPDDTQLTEAMKLSKGTKMLPSQNMKLQKKTSFRFSYPVQIIKVAETGSSTNIIGLDKLEEDVFKNRMEMIKRRLKEIAKIKRENRLAHQYADKIIQSNIQMQQEAEDLWKKVSDKNVNNPAKSPDPAWAIPQLTQLRKDIETSIENYRVFLSDLDVDLDELLQKEWVILERALDTKRDAISKLMNNASVRYRLVILPEDAENDEGGEE